MTLWYIIYSILCCIVYVWQNIMAQRIKNKEKEYEKGKFWYLCHKDEDFLIPANYPQPLVLIVGIFTCFGTEKSINSLLYIFGADNFLKFMKAIKSFSFRPSWIRELVTTFVINLLGWKKSIWACDWNLE